MNWQHTINRMDKWFDSLAGQTIIYELLTTLVVTLVLLTVTHVIIKKLKTNDTDKRRFAKKIQFGSSGHKRFEDRRIDFPVHHQQILPLSG